MSEFAFDKEAVGLREKSRERAPGPGRGSTVQNRLGSRDGHRGSERFFL